MNRIIAKYEVGVSLSQEPQQQEKKRIYKHFHESTLAIMHFQHANGFSLVLEEENFSFLPHMLQQQNDRLDLFFVVFKSIFVFVAAAIPSHLAQQITYLTHAHLYYSLVKPSFP